MSRKASPLSPTCTRSIRRAHYCDRIIGMAAGKVVFDGTPDELTDEAARSIYGADGLKDAFSEAITSTSIEPRLHARADPPALEADSAAR